MQGDIAGSLLSGDQHPPGSQARPSSLSGRTEAGVDPTLLLLVGNP